MSVVHAVAGRHRWNGVTHGAADASTERDGSAVVNVGDGYFLNATDEDNVIRLYKRGVIDARAHFDARFSQTEKNKRDEPKESISKGRPNRAGCIRLDVWKRLSGNARSADRLFATTLTGAGAH